MQGWRVLKEKLASNWYNQRQRRVLVAIVAGLSLLLGIGIGIYRNWPVEETPVVDVVSREEMDAAIQVQVQNVIAELYPWVLEGPTIQLVSVEPPTSPRPQPTEPKPKAKAEPDVSFEHLIWPVQGEVATPFGWYRHPVYGDWRFNAGVEFNATGEQVRTVLAGKVVSVTSNELETELIIDHGGGWASVYRSIRGISVGPGDRVEQNQNIALPESTGLVFFGLTHNEEPVNPQAFLR